MRCVHLPSLTVGLVGLVGASVAVSGCSAILDTDDYTRGALTANAGPDQFVEPSTTVQLDASASAQTANRGMEFRWEQVAGTPVTLSDATSGSPSFTAPSTPGELGFVVHVDDGVSGDATDDVAIVVDSSPVVDLGADRDVMTMTPVYLDATSAFDPDVEPLTFTWTQTAGPSVQLTGADSPIASFTTSSETGSLAFHVEACDALGQCRSDDLSVRVHRWTRISAAEKHVVLLRSDGTAWGLGAFADSVLGPIGQDATYPVRIHALTDVTDVRASHRATFTKAGGVLYAHGLSIFGNLGIATPGTYGAFTEPTPVDASLQGARSFDRSATVAAFVTAAGALVTFGEGNFGELGSCSTTTAAFPAVVTIPPPTIGATWSAVHLGRFYGSEGFGLAIESLGQNHTWGTHMMGQLGLGALGGGACVAPTATMTPTGLPLSVASTDHSMAYVSSSGRLYSWGWRQSGGSTNLATPVQRGTFTDWRTVGATFNDAYYAIRSNGALYTWGEGSRGELGLGDIPLVDRYPSPDTAAPFQIGTDTDWADVAGSDYNGFGLKTDGTLWAWGDSTTPLVGNGSTPYGGGQPLASPVRLLASEPGRCGDGIVQTRFETPTSLNVAEICDDGPRNGSPGACSTTCSCPTTGVVFVDASATGAANGTSWENAFTTVQAAASVAGPCSAIWVAAGTYRPASDHPNDPIVTMGSGLSVFGGFGGFESHFAQRDVARHLTILDGGGTSRHVVVGGNGGVLDGVVVRGGAAIGAAPDDVGGGLLLTASGEDEFFVRDVVFEANHATTAGGAVFVDSAVGAVRSATFQRIRVVENSSVSGGGLALLAGRFRVHDAVFVGNRAEGAAGPRRGGGLYVTDECSDLIVVNDVFVGNSATDDGSAVWSDAPTDIGDFQVAFVSARGNTGGGTAIRSEGVTSGGPGAVIHHLAMWNPGSATEIQHPSGSVGYSCFPSSPNPLPGGNGNVGSADDPFVEVGTGSSLSLFLAPTSVCRDRGVGTAATGSLPYWWQASSTQDGVADVDPPDSGFHHVAP